jgi:ribosomal protein L11 methyltransferase
MNDSLYCCRVQDDSLDPGVTTELLAALDLPYSTWTDCEGGSVWHSLYADTEAVAQAASRRLRREAQAWREFGVRLGMFDVVRLRREDWAEAWKVHFPVQQVSARLVIKPSWREHVAAPGEVVIELDPGMSFGTGRHATSRFCLRQLDRLREASRQQSLLDAGCGSGILTVAAVKLGYAPVTAFDSDPGCVISTQENLRRNNIAEGEVRVLQEDIRLLVLRRRFDVIAANLQTPTLLACRTRFAELLVSGGALVAAGILEGEYPGLRESFLKDGWCEEVSETEEGWTGGVFKRG